MTDLGKNPRTERKSVDTKELVKAEVVQRIAKGKVAMEKNGMNSEERNDSMERNRGSEVTAAKVKYKDEIWMTLKMILSVKRFLESLRDWLRLKRKTYEE